MMEINKETTVCFSGHRPEKLPGEGRASSGKTRVIKSMLYDEILRAVDDGFDTFITGMQRGIDLWAGEIVLELAPVQDLRLIAAMPYSGFGKNFRGTEKWNYCRILNRAVSVVTISAEYTPTCMKLRNNFMVDNSSRLIAVIGDERSGTGQTLRYAEKCGLEIRRIKLDSVFSVPDDEDEDLFDFKLSN